MPKIATKPPTSKDRASLLGSNFVFIFPAKRVSEMLSSSFQMLHGANLLLLVNIYRLHNWVMQNWGFYVG